MNTVVEWIVVLFLVGVACWLMWRLREKWAKALLDRDEYWAQRLDDKTHTLIGFAEQVRGALPKETRYEVVLADWGPDFTGEGDILPRWRWSILDADRALREALGVAPEIGSREVPFMLGNEVSAVMAMEAALEWIEEQEKPLLSVVVGEVTPWGAPV